MKFDETCCNEMFTVVLFHSGEVISLKFSVFVYRRFHTLEFQFTFHLFIIFKLWSRMAAEQFEFRGGGEFKMLKN